MITLLCYRYQFYVHYIGALHDQDLSNTASRYKCTSAGYVWRASFDHFHRISGSFGRLHLFLDYIFDRPSIDLLLSHRTNLLHGTMEIQRFSLKNNTGNFSAFDALI